MGIIIVRSCVDEYRGDINEIKEILKVRDKFQEESNECASQIYWEKSRD